MRIQAAALDGPAVSIWNEAMIAIPMTALNAACLYDKLRVTDRTEAVVRAI
jgi:hypothetical protein